ncbi:MAG: hypothetical protein ACREAA_06605 [Candidatus Polarisedimenticolia bacterium]
MPQAPPRTARARKGRKMTSQEAVLLNTRRGEPLISGVTDGETFHLIVEPSSAPRRIASPRGETRSLFQDVEPLADQNSGPRITEREELAHAGLPYRFVLACSGSIKDDHS